MLVVNIFNYGLFPDFCIRIVSILLQIELYLIVVMFIYLIIFFQDTYQTLNYKVSIYLLNII